MTVPDNKENLQRHLSARHIQLIAISGAIGTGLFMGSARTIALAGPSVIFAYMIIGFFLFFVMRAMGEILLSNLNYKSFSDFTSDILGPWAGFFTGWTYWLCWIVTGIADVIAIAAYMKFWFPELFNLVPMLGAILLFLLLNILTVKLFGETEFWFSMIKVITIITLIAVGLYLVLTGFTYQAPGTNLEIKAQFSNLWEYDGMFSHGAIGFFAGFQIAIFAFVGIELVGAAAAEAKDPEKNIPKAINSVPIRVILFYVLALALIMSVIPWIYFDSADGSITSSPFVKMFTIIGFPAAASLINFVVLTSAASSANSGIYSTSRMLFGLSLKNKAPTLFSYLSKNSVPVNGLLFSCICLVIGVLLTYSIPNAMSAFQIVTTISTILFIFIWSMILIAYLGYRRKYPERHRSSKFKMPAGRLMSILTLGFFVFVLFVLAFEPETLKGLIATPIWFVILLITYAYNKKRNLSNSE